MKYILLALFGLASIAKAGPQWSNIDVQSRDIAFVAGYLSASIYDIPNSNRQEYWKPNDTMPHLNNKMDNMHCVGWKMGLGLLAGSAVAICHASDGSPIQFTDIVFGGLGGMTCVVVHF